MPPTVVAARHSDRCPGRSDAADAAILDVVPPPPCHLHPGQALTGSVLRTDYHLGSHVARPAPQLRPGREATALAVTA
ncbi:hypothetical protein ACFYQQ_21460 [Streptomyces sp. NPDC005496]|uniref:hypothetical protein n=1 Tax=unclassified Streptomyces TaxID=2593676 RepID=UPI0033B7930E